MQQLPQLQAGIANLRELRDLFRAMRALAASHVQEAQEALSGIRRYTEVVEDSIAEGAALLAQSDAMDTTGRALDGGLLIVVCSEHGFVGAFNEQLLAHAVAVRQADQKLVIIGSRGSVLAAEQKLGVDLSFSMATHIGGVVGVTRRVAEHMSAVAIADIVFGGYRRGGGYEPEVRHILPLDPTLLVGSRRRGAPLHQIAPGILLQQLAREYLFAEITRAVMESFASENAARLRVMENADHNIADKLAEMRRLENALRQEAITSELIDVVTGAEAIFSHQNVGFERNRLP
jgi:F-type H+-transporting ATPase subunit gamma